MKLVMTLLVRDEEDIIDWNLRYHLSRGIAHFIVTDNLSVDGTRDILREYERRGVATIIEEPSDDYSQDLWVTRMAKLAQDRHFPDWILHCDADEFWWPEQETDLRQAFANVPDETAVIEVERHNYLGHRDKQDGPFFTRMTHRQRRSINYLGCKIGPKIAHRHLQGISISQGNHGVLQGNELLPASPAPALSILHFPARSPDQFKNKIAKGGAAYERNTRLPTTLGDAWREMHGVLQAGDFEPVLASHFLSDSGDLGLDDTVEDLRFRDYLRSL